MSHGSFSAISSVFQGYYGDFLLNLEEPYNLLKYKRFGRMAENWVMNWQPCLFLRFALSCLTRPLVLVQKYEEKSETQL